SRQDFDVWKFPTPDDDAGTPSYFGKLAPQVIENLLWLYTEPGQIVVDPFAGGGTVIDVAKRMGRRGPATDVWPRQLCQSTNTTLPADGPSPPRQKPISLFWTHRTGFRPLDAIVLPRLTSAICHSTIFLPLGGKR